MIKNDDFEFRDQILFESKRFIIKFDIYTPRPHFIVLFAEKRPNKRGLQDLSDDEIIEMFELIDEFRREFELVEQNMMLSFHTGFWVSAFFISMRSIEFL